MQPLASKALFPASREAGPSRMLQQLAPVETTDEAEYVLAVADKVIPLGTLLMPLFLMSRLIVPKS